MTSTMIALAMLILPPMGIYSPSWRRIIRKLHRNNSVSAFLPTHSLAYRLLSTQSRA